MIPSLPSPSLPRSHSLAVTVFTLSPTFVSESSVLLEEDTDDWIDTGNVVGPNGFPAAPPVNYEAAAPSSGADAGSASPALSPAESDGESDGESLAESNGKSGGESDCGGERRSGRRASLLPGGTKIEGSALHTIAGPGVASSTVRRSARGTTSAMKRSTSSALRLGGRRSSTSRRRASKNSTLLAARGRRAPRTGTQHRSVL